MFLSIDSQRSTSRASSSRPLNVTDGQAYEDDQLRKELEREKLKAAIDEVKNRGSGGSANGSGTSGSSGPSESERVANDRAYQASEDEKNFQRQRTLAADRDAAQSRMAADDTANRIRERREASSRGAAMQKALSRARR